MGGEGGARGVLIRQCSQRAVRGCFLSLGCLSSAPRKVADVDD